jgi:hypothetical protein
MPLPTVAVLVMTLRIAMSNRPNAPIFGSSLETDVPALSEPCPPQTT